LGAWRPQAPRLDRGLQRSREARRHGRAGLTGPGPIRRGQEGEDVSPWKIVEGRRGNRFWVDESAAATSISRLGVDPHPDTLATPAEIERRLAKVGVKVAKQFLALYTDRAPGKLTLVPDQDNRQALSAVVEETFQAE